jgi:hypothetical protein
MAKNLKDGLSIELILEVELGEKII